jgi:hypothetical protein
MTATPSSIRTERLAMPASNRSIPFLPVPSSPSRTLRYRLGVAPFLLGAAVALTLSACGTSRTPPVSQSGSPAANPSAAAAGGSSPRAAARGPAASGLIAAVSGSTLQVQNAQVGQVAVLWTAATKFTQQVTLSLGSIKAGDCVTAAATAGSPTAASFTATAVTVSQAVNGRCFGGFGGGTVPSPGSSFQARPRPSGTRSFARPSGAARTGAFATGSVVSVSGSTIVVASRSFGPGADASPGASPGASAGTTTNKTVTLTSATKITTVRSATAAAATVGRCVTAQGKTDSTGAVAATSIAVTDPVNGQCTSGFGGFGGFGAGGRRGQAATTGGTSA